MRVFARITLGWVPELNSLIDSLRSLFPERVLERGFFCFASLDDDRTQKALSLMESAGLKPWNFTQGMPRKRESEFSIALEREYDGDDLAACDFLEIFPPAKAYHFEASLRTESGEMIIPQRQMPRGFDIMSDGLFRAYFVAENTRAILQSFALKGVKFKPAAYRPSGKAAHAEKQIAALSDRPYWELDSDSTMPPLSPTVALTDRNGKPVRRDDFSNGLQRSEGLFTHPELHYRQSDIEKLEPFDLARTFEPFGNRSGYERLFCPLVASKRFYETCVANKLKTGWVPVRIDPD